jgi:hypothetical protein
MSNPSSTGHDEGKKKRLENRMLARIFAREAIENLYY